MQPKLARGQRLAYAAYGVSLGVAGVAALPALPWLAGNSRGQGLAQRFGKLDAGVAAVCGQQPIWVHAASVGEVLAAEPLVGLLRAREPSHPVVMSTTSLTGRHAAQARLGVPATLLPADLPWIVRRALDVVHPAALVIIETELWPNLLRAAGRRGIPVLLVSARVSPRAARRYAWIRQLTSAALGYVSVVAAQTDEDAARLIHLGAPAERVQVVGNLKFARAALPCRKSRPPLPLGERPVLVAASTQPGEEEIVLEACHQVWGRHPSALLVLAPRRPQRFGAVATLLEESGIAWIRRSRAGVVPPDAKVLLLDSLGELPGFLPPAAIAFVGGSLVALGGHNVLEPGRFGVPACFGPHVENVRAAAEVLLKIEGAVMISSASELALLWLRVLDNPKEGKRMGERARAEVEKRATVAERTFALVRDALRGNR